LRDEKEIDEYMNLAREIKGEGFGGIRDEETDELLKPVSDSVSEDDAEEDRVLILS
jgi:hypothetical protein